MPRLFYFDVYGKAEAIRMVLWFTNQKYEDVRMSPELFSTLNAQGFFPLK